MQLIFHLCFYLILCALVFISFVNASTAIQGKFRNLTNRKLRLFWVNFDKEPYFISNVPAGGEESFATYEGHSFFWAELEGLVVPLTHEGSETEKVSFIINTNMLPYVVTDATTTREQMEQYEEELNFMVDYKKRTGRNWINIYPRDPVIFDMWDCDYSGQIHSVQTTEETAQWLCEEEIPKCSH